MVDPASVKMDMINSCVDDMIIEEFYPIAVRRHSLAGLFLFWGIDNKDLEVGSL